ncbi:MAG: hypothetical protein E6G10_07860 [Actinobacteria bacterium]|nr:MAG: hypothetical protein E6G10_07860 [Actinomycetota bacterium]
MGRLQLLSERPRAVQLTVPVALPLIGGFLTGWTLAGSAGLWVVANVVAILGGVAAGFDHDGAAAGARRGALGGLLFGLALVLADATVVGHRAATLPKPAILLAVLTTVVGSLLGALGGTLRHRAMHERAAPSA